MRFFFRSVQGVREYFDVYFYDTQESNLSKRGDTIGVKKWNICQDSNKKMYLNDLYRMGKVIYFNMRDEQAGLRNGRGY